MVEPPVCPLAEKDQPRPKHTNIVTCEEEFISRSNTRPFLKVRHESFVGVDGSAQSSKTKTQASTTYVGLYPQTKTFVSPNFRKTSVYRLTRKLRRKTQQIQPRIILHIGILTGAMALVSYCGISATEAGAITNTASNVASGQDSATTLAAGAVLAKSADILIGNDVQKKADTSNITPAVVTAGDDFLDKKQPILTAGSPTRDILTYTVAGGDTLSTIAQKFNITTTTILWANNLADDATIKPNQQLIILPVSGVLYTVAAGDTAESIAAKYQANASIIESYNNLSGDPIEAGTKLIVPDGIVPAAPKPAVTQPAILSSAFSARSQINFRGGANSYAFGYCTWYVANKRYIPANLGNANQWPYNAAAAGMTVSNTPVVGAAGVLRYGNHVVYIERVEGGMVYYSEMNGPAGWDRVGYGSAPASNFRYIY